MSKRLKVFVPTFESIVACTKSYLPFGLIRLARAVCKLVELYMFGGGNVINMTSRRENM